MDYRKLTESDADPLVSKSGFPLTVEAGQCFTRDFGEWCEERRDDIISAVRATGAVLFRGFGLDTSDSFGSAVEQVASGALDYRGGTSPRTKVHEGVYTSTEYPRDYEIALHNEMSYSARSPEFVFFGCLIAPEARGETPIADCRRVMRRLPRALVEEFSERGVMYERNMFGRKSSYNSWAKAFETTDPLVVSRYCTENDIGFEWRANDGLRTREIRPALCIHPVTGEEVWFNQVNLWHYSNSPLAAAMGTTSEQGLPMNVFFGDGGSIGMEKLNAIRAAYAEEKTLFQWRQGDFLMLDNKLAAHGRMPFSGDRRIVVAMRTTVDVTTAAA